MPAPVHLIPAADLEVSPVPRQVIRRRLEELWLHVNFPCNLACTHCLFSCSPHYDGGIPDLSLEQAPTIHGRSAGSRRGQVLHHRR